MLLVSSQWRESTNGACDAYNSAVILLLRLGPESALSHPWRMVLGDYWLSGVVIASSLRCGVYEARREGDGEKAKMWM